MCTHMIECDIPIFLYDIDDQAQQFMGNGGRAP